MTHPHDIAYRCYNEFIQQHGIPPIEFWMDIATLKQLDEALLAEHHVTIPGPFTNRYLFGLPIRISAERGIWAVLSVGGNPTTP